MSKNEQELIHIKIVNWDKYQPHQARMLKKPYWFALSNQINDDMEIQSLNDAEFRCWVSILCERSRQNKAKMSIIPNIHRRKYSTNESILRSVLKKASEFGWIQIISIIDREEIDEKSMHITRQYNTIQNKRTLVESPDSTNVIKLEEFEKIYQEYPRKEGKAAGIRSARDQIKNMADLSLLISAVRKYKSMCEENGTERQYVKLFSTFMGSRAKPIWRDYLDTDVGTGGKKTKTWQEIAKERGF